MKWVLVVVAALMVVVLIVVVIGALLPRDHVATRSARIAAPPAAVWTALTAPADFPSWRRDIVRVEILAATASGPSWREFSKHGALTMETDAAEPPRRLVSRIADKGLPYGGAWEYTVVPDGSSASRVTITERGSVYNPIFRFVSRFIMGHTATIDAYLRQLGAHFGEEVVPESVPTLGGSHGV